MSCESPCIAQWLALFLAVGRRMGMSRADILRALRPAVVEQALDILEPTLAQERGRVS